MDLAQKKAYIVSALEKFPARIIDVSGKGANLRRLDRVSESKLEELYQQVLELENQDKTKKDKRQKEADTPHWILSLQDKIQELQTALDVLLFKLSKLDEKIDVLSLGKTKPKARQVKQDEQEVLGFRIMQKWVGSGGKRYLKWYGLQQREGKQVWVYVGEEVGKAEEKIRQWLKNHN
jgi:hypothetical protein